MTTPADQLHLLVVIGSLSKKSAIRNLLLSLAKKLEGPNHIVEVVDFSEEPLPLFDPEKAYQGEIYLRLKQKVDRADVFLLGTPDYHGSMSSALKNFLDHFWHEFAGKLFGTVVGSYEKGLTVTDQIRTVARQCYAWSLPYGISFVDKEDVRDGEILSPAFEARARMFLRDLTVYGSLLAKQRQADLACEDQCFMARHRVGGNQ